MYVAKKHGKNMNRMDMAPPVKKMLIAVKKPLAVRSIPRVDSRRPVSEKSSKITSKLMHIILFN